MPEGGSELRMNNICRKEHTDMSEKEEYVRWLDLVWYRWRDCGKMAVVEIHGGRARIVGKQT